MNVHVYVHVYVYDMYILPVHLCRAPFLLPPVVAAYARSRPEIALTIYEETTARLVDAVANGAIDLGIASLPIDDHVSRITANVIRRFLDH